MFGKPIKNINTKPNQIIRRSLLTVLVVVYDVANATSIAFIHATMNDF